MLGAWLPSSPGAKYRPRAGCAPITRKNEAETAAASNCSGRSTPVRFTVTGVNAATSSKTRFQSRRR